MDAVENCISYKQPEPFQAIWRRVGKDRVKDPCMQVLAAFMTLNFTESNQNMIKYHMQTF